MPTLREILDQRKNANAKTLVLRPQAEQKTLPQETAGAEGTISAIIRPEGEIRQSGTTESDSILGAERPGTEPPPGLTRLQEIQWRKKNAVNSEKIIPENKPVLPVSVEPSSVPVSSAGAAVSNEKSVREVPVPPPGLKGIQLLLWKKNHGNGQQAEQSPQINKVETKNNTLVERGTDTKPQEVSPSQIADNNKTNAGVADLGSLKQNLIYLANNIEQKELVGQVVRTIAVQLVNSPELTPHMTNADVNLVVRGLRSAYSIAARKKQDTKDARVKKSADTSELSAMFKEAGLSLKLT